MADEARTGSPAEVSESPTGGNEPVPQASAALEQAFFAGGDAIAAASESPQQAAELDPELLKLPKRSRYRRHPVISFVVIGLSVYLMFFLREDLLFFFQSRQPSDIEELGPALRQARLKNNTYVTLHGVPDRKHALVLEGRMGGYDSFVRLLEANNRVFVQQHREMRATDQELGTVHTGQLVRFSSLPYAAGLREYLGRNMTTAHDLPFSEVARAWRPRGPQADLRDLRGETVRIEPTTMLWINAAFPQEWIVQFSKQHYAKPEAAAMQLTALHLPFVAEGEPSQLFWRFIVHAEPDQTQVLFARFRDPELHAGVVRRQLSYAVRWEQLIVEGKSLVVRATDASFPTHYRPAPDSQRLVPAPAEAVRIPAESVLYITASASFAVPADAMVLLTGKAPRDNWFYVVLFVVLLAFVTVNLAALAARFRLLRRPAR